ncbi:MAG: hypothetical protein JNL26_13095, partial [Gemmatimonadetes bacterium]|nr:hypothetical protein [Gemmatimonadota bacterium]
VVEVDGTAVRRIDHDVAEVLREFVSSAAARGLTVRTTGLDRIFGGPAGLAH